MQISTRNLFKGTVKSVQTGMVNAEIVLEVAPGIEIQPVKESRGTVATLSKPTPEAGWINQ